MYPISADIITAKILPSIIDTSDKNIPFTLNSIKFREKPKNGDIRGAITIPPIMIEVLFKIKPMAIMGADRAMSTKKSKDGRLYCSK